MIGQTISHYKILEKLGEGGMGVVYRALDTHLDRPVALKLLPADKMADPERKKRFVQEAKAASALNHPNIVTIYEIGHSGGVHFIATELIEGQTLRLLITKGKMILREALDIAAQIANALNAAHAAGIVHRDIKPENVMVRPDGFVKVLDFGLAKLAERQVPKVDANTPTAFRMTEPGTIMGTAHYLSPEQARGLEVDSRTDIFSLSVLLYELLTGRVPFEGVTSTDIILSIIEKEPVPLSHHWPRVPAELQWIVSKGLRKDRERRYQTVKDLAVDLKSLGEELDFEAKRSHSQPSEISAGEATTTKDEKARIATEQPGFRREERAVVHTISSAEFVFGEIKQHKRGISFVLAVMTLTIATLVYFSFGSDVVDSVAVMPFANASTDPNAEDLSDNVTQSIFNALAQVPNLKVKPQSSVLRLKGQEPEAIGRELKAHSVLSGEVSQRGERLTINLELIDVLHDVILWREQYKLKLTEVLSVQEQVAREISEKLRLKLSGAEKKRLEAYQIYLKGRSYWNKRTKEDLQEAIKYFQQAADNDPKYAPAYAGLADCYNQLVAYNVIPPKVAFPEAKVAAEKAIALDTTLAEAHASLAYEKWRYDWDWAGAESEFKRALGLDPSYASARQFYAIFLATLGRTAEAVEAARHTQKLDSLSLIVNADLALVYYLARQYDLAIEQCRHTLELDPNFFPAHRYLGLAYEQKGMFTEAITELDQAARLSGGSAQMRATLGHGYAAAGRRNEALKILNGLEEMAKQAYVSPYDIATIYNALGDQNQAFKWLDRALEERSGWLVYLKVNPILDNLHSDPRFQALLQRIGFKS
jgi:serine/threonine protein kinase/tetratricopeptide (TPR) repeat protein